MFKHILVPTDGTQRSRNAVQVAIRLYELEKSQAGVDRITLLHVIETISDDADPEFERFYASLQKKAHKRMQSLLRDCPREAPIVLQVLLGNRVREILHFAEDEQVDLIILSSHRIDHQDLTRGWGTISHKIGILSPCPVMLVK